MEQIPNEPTERGPEIVTDVDVVPVPVRGQRLRHAIAWLRASFAWIVLGIAFFLLFAYLAIPTKAIAWRLGYEAAKAGYNVTVEDVSVRPWGVAVLRGVRWTYEPTRKGIPPQKYFVDALRVRVRILPLLWRSFEVYVTTDRAPEDETGDIEVFYRLQEDMTELDVHVDNIELWDVPKASQALGVPLSGYVTLTVNLKVPKHRLQATTGTIAFECSECRAGDGESKLYMPGAKSSLSEEGLTIPEIDIGSLNGRFVVDDGSATLDPPLVAESDDMSLSVTGGIDFQEPITNSQFAMLLKVALSDALLSRSDRVELMYNGAAVDSKLDPPEEGLGFKLRGSVTKPKFYGIKAETPLERRANRRAKNRVREQRRVSKQSNRTPSTPNTRSSTTSSNPRTAVRNAKTDDDSRTDEAEPEDLRDEDARTPRAVNRGDERREDPTEDERRDARNDARDGGEADDVDDHDRTSDDEPPTDEVEDLDDPRGEEPEFDDGDDIEVLDVDDAELDGEPAPEETTDGDPADDAER